MGRRRGSVATLACALGALALILAGCGAEERVNDPRPQPPTRVSVSVTEDAVTVQPERIAIGPEPTQQIPQNEGIEQPAVRSNAPLDVVLVAANLTDTDSKLVLRGPKDVSSGELVANGNASQLTDLPTGTYEIVAAGLPDAKPARLVVGPFRTSSENDILLP
ncbi:MAG TPA: hypothetical protein VF259_05515 [Solirubrobacterales bacterium]